MKKLGLFLFLFLAFFINVKAEEYLTDILVDNTSIFEGGKFDYEYSVDSSKTTIKLDYRYDQSNFFGMGDIGSQNLNYGANIFTYVLTNRENADDSKTYTIKVNRPDTRSGDNSLTSLIVGNQKIVLGDTNEYSVSFDTKTTSVEIKATLPNGASFVDGYGERVGSNAVKLSSDKTTVEVKVKAENESIRNYTIHINKTNVQSNDATLKSLKIEGVDFDFKSDKLEYDLSVEYKITKVKINAVKNNDKANLDYSENVTLKTGTNLVEIKVTAEDGTVKTYKLNITREEEIPIVKDITITGINFEFKPKTYNYKIETTLSKLDFNVTLSDEDATSEITGNENLKNGSIIKIEAKDGEESVLYTFRIINKEEDKEEDVSTTTTGNSSNNLNEFLKENEMIMSLVILGIGIFSTLVAVVMKRKSKIM
ncbi:MAG: cadherin-like beta sandwich domain-containing protein [Bacilli bacterium]|nr:cadherin-like beta sandwich domain-containing protein [Bacilli bacterium]